MNIVTNFVILNERPILRKLITEWQAVSALHFCPLLCEEG